MGNPTGQTYVFDHTWDEERRRLKLLEAHHDPSSRRRIERTGLDAGWRCLEVGAGSGSIARWLGRRVGARGSVLAIDLVTDLLDEIDEPNVEIRSADVLELDLPPRSFDLIHARAVLTHIPERTRAIERMVSWLAPDGWLVVEEIDWLGQTTTDPSWSALLAAYVRATPTADWACGRELVPELASAGLEKIDADASVDTIQGGTPMADWYALNIRALRGPLLAAGTATEADVDRQLAQLQDPAFRALGMAWIGAWGRR